MMFLFLSWQLTEFAVISFALTVVFIIAIILDMIGQTSCACCYLCSDETNEKKESSKARHIMCLVSTDLLITLCLIMCGTSVIIFPSYDLTCNSITRIWFILFHLNRCMLYVIFLHKMVIMYKDTIIPFNINTHKSIIYAMIIIYCILYLIIPLATSYILYIDFISLQTTYTARDGCVFYDTNHWFTFEYTSSIFHILMIIYLLHLFINPLRQLVAIQGETGNKQMTYSLDAVMVKYGILHSMSIISGILLIIFCVLFPSGYDYTVMDAFANGIILLLLSPIHNTVYKYLCCILHPFCMVCVCKSVPDEHQMLHIHKPNTDVDDTHQTHVESEAFTSVPKSVTEPNETKPGGDDHEVAIALEITTLDRHGTNRSNTRLALTDFPSVPDSTGFMDFKSYQQSFLSSGDDMTIQEFNDKSTHTVQLLRILSSNL
eukprot:285526_1